MKEELLFCKEARQTSKDEEFSNIIDSYMTTNLLEWSNCMGVCTDGACCMSGIRGELQNLFTKNTLVLYGHTA
jgi:hypothetical protein